MRMKHFFIDSENVGDFWIPLLNLPAEETDLIVFYTKNSPHMSYESLIKLKESDRKVTFVKCYEGTNALDFQLCSELGYRLCENKGDEFIIVTNDTGYDAAVKYWRHRKYPVKRITGKESRFYDKQTPQPPVFKERTENTPEKAPSEAAPSELRTVPENVAEELLQEAVTEVAAEMTAEAVPAKETVVAEEAAVPVEETAVEEAVTEEAVTEEAVPEEELQPETAQEEPAEEEEVPEPDLEELTVIATCIGTDNLAELHNQLIQFYGDNGKSFYQSIKNGSIPVKVQDWDKSEKFLYYCALIVRHSDLEEALRSEESISALADFLCGAESKRHNLNSLRYALLKKFGKDLGRRYYFLLKPYVKAMNQM